jgi:transposase
MDDHSDDLRRPKPTRIEVFAGVGRRRWDDALKAQIVMDSLAPGAVVVEVARRHGCRPQQVHDWRRQARQGLLAVPGIELVSAPSPLFVPLLTSASPEPALKAAKVFGDIIVEVDGAVMHVRGRPSSDALFDVLAALRKTHGC